MLAHGADPDNLDEESFRQICVMYADGMIGNKALLETLGSLTGAVYNYMRPAEKSAYLLKDILGRGYDYFYPPQDKNDEANESLLLFLSQAQGFDEKMFKGG